MGDAAPNRREDPQGLTNPRKRFARALERLNAELQRFEALLEQERARLKEE